VRALVGEEPATQEGEAEEGGSTKERAGRRQLATIFDLLVLFYRDLLALRVGGVAADRIVNQHRARRLQKLAQSGSPERWVACLDALLLARRRLQANANIPLVTESLLMTLLSGR
jgi:DNA polymerase-3 subunit delta'